MTINDHAEVFNDKKVVQFDPAKGVNDTNLAYRVGLDWDDIDDGKEFGDLLQAYISDPNASAVDSLLIGCWGEPYENTPDKIISLLADNASKLPNLQAVFFGDIIMEESEISWIEQVDYREFFVAYPNIKHFKIRGTQGLRLRGMDLPNLETLVVESGGLPKAVMEDIKTANLPQLKHLELWLGTDDYGFDGSADDVKSLMEKPFPCLTYLGLRNSEMADEVAAMIAKASIVEQIKVLDMSMGNMTDKGAAALLSSPHIGSLQKLDLHFHYISDEYMGKLRDIGIELDLSDKQEEDEYDGEVYRYIAVSE